MLLTRRSTTVARVLRNLGYTPGRSLYLPYTAEMLSGDYPLGTLLSAVTLTITMSFGGATVLAKTITSVLTSAGQITDTGVDGVGAFFFELTAAETRTLGALGPLAFDIVVTDSRGLQSQPIDGGSLVPQPSTAGAGVDHVVVTPATADIFTAGTQQLVATVYDVDNNVLVGRVVTWLSSDPLVAMVDVNGLVTAIAAGSVIITATSEGVSDTATLNVASVGDLTSLELKAAFDALAVGGATLEALYLENVRQTPGGAGKITAWDNDLNPGQGEHFRATVETPAGASVTGSGAVYGDFELPNSTGLTGGARFHADPNTLVNSLIPGASGLANVHGDYSAGLTWFGFGKLVNGRILFQVGEDADANKVVSYGDDVGNLQALHNTSQWTKAQDANVGTDPMHWCCHVRESAQPAGNVGSGIYWIYRRYARDILQIGMMANNPVAAGRRFRLGPGVQGASGAQNCIGVIKGNPNAAQTRLLNDWAKAKWPTLWDDTARAIGIHKGNSYEELFFTVTRLRDVVEGQGAGGISGFGATATAVFWGQSAKQDLYGLIHFLAGNDFSKRPATNSVIVAASEFINGGTPAQNYYWLDRIRALDPSRVRIAMHNLIFGDIVGQNLNFATYNTDLLANAVAGGHADVLVDFSRSQIWTLDPGWYVDGDIDRRSPIWFGLHLEERAEKLMTARYRVMWKAAKGDSVTNDTVEIYATPYTVNLSPSTSLTATPAWVCKNWLDVTLGGKTLTFSSDNTAVATVDPNTGVITAVGNGETVIFAKSSDDAWGGCVVYVTGMGVVTEMAYLRTNLSQNTDTSVLFSTERGVTIPGTGFEPNGVSQWASVLLDAGNTAGPVLVADDSNGRRPLWDAVNKLITSEAGDHLVSDVPSALFNTTGAYTLVVIMSSPQTGASSYLAAISGGSFARLLGLRQSSGAGGTVSVLNPDVAVDSTVVVGATRRLWIATKNAGNGIGIQVPNNAKVTGTGGSGQPSGTASLAVFASDPTGAPNNLGTVNRVLCLPWEATAGDITVIKTWAQTYAGASLL